MTATHSVTEQELAATPGDQEQHRSEQPYAILWLAGREILLYEDDRGEFFTA